MLKNNTDPLTKSSGHKLIPILGILPKYTLSLALLAIFWKCRVFLTFSDLGHRPEDKDKV